MAKQLGYACINIHLRKQGIRINRKMIKKTFTEHGIKYASELALQNAKDLVEIIKWNHANGIKLFRMSSGIFPWMSEYEISDLPDYTKISNILKGAGTLAKSYNQRLSFHPGPFVVLASPSPSVVDNSIKELNQHAETMDLMGLPQSNYAKINIHVGGAYGDKIAAMARFCKSFKRLTPSAQSRLTIENDDRASMYSVVDLYHGIHKVIGIPIVFDYHHHQFCTGDLSEKAALHLASTTWPDRIKQCVHYSESKALHENNPKIKPQAHSDYIHDRINSWDLPLDIMVESKAKELSIQDYMTNLEN